MVSAAKKIIGASSSRVSVAYNMSKPMLGIPSFMKLCFHHKAQRKEAVYILVMSRRKRKQNEEKGLSGGRLFGWADQGFFRFVFTDKQELRLMGKNI